MPSVMSRRPTAASRSLAEQLQPLVRVHDAVRAHGYASVDVDEARARIDRGRIAFDAASVLHSAGDLSRPFQRAATAFERAGVASTPQRLALRGEALDAAQLAVGWCNGDSPPVDPTLRLARSVAGLIGNAVLAGVASQIVTREMAASWRRPQCPCCGASPDLALVTDTRRQLVCWRCDMVWRTDRAGCISCGANLEPELVRVRSPHLGYALVVCNACGRYLKERRGAPVQSLVVERALTAGLDAAAQERGLRA